MEDCESRLRQLQALEDGPHEDEEAFEMCAAYRMYGIERMVARHKNRELFLMFARNHVAWPRDLSASESDLRLLEWLPVEEPSTSGRF